MADLIGVLAVAIVELIAAAVQLCMQIVAMVLESLGFAAGHLAKKPAVGERRFSVRRLVVAFAPLAIVVALIAGLILILD